VLLLGVNNLIISRASPEDTARGIRAVNAAVRDRLPRARILHLAFFPAGETPSDWLRQKIAQTHTPIIDPRPISGETEKCLRENLRHRFF